MTQEQAIQEAKDRVAKKKAYSSFQTWKSDLSENFSDPKAALIKFMEEVAIEYSSSQLEAKGREIAILTKENKLLRSDGYEKEITELKSQLQQATASSSSKDPDAVCERCHKKVYLSYIMREEGLCFCDHPKLPPSSTKRFSLEEVKAMMIDARHNKDILIDDCIKAYYPEYEPSEHTEVKDVVMGRNSSLTQQKMNEPKAGEGREGGFGKWTGNEGNGYDPKSV